MENKIRYLEMIQGVISRMAGNLFLLKGWVVTLVAALLALMASKDSDPRLVFVVLIPILIFWLLDGYFLSQERMYRSLYNEATKADPDKINFSMDASRFNSGRNTWFRTLFSKTLIIFYGLLLILFLIIVAYNFHIKLTLTVG